MNRFAQVLQILDDAIGGPSVTIGAHGAFWRGLSRDQFVQKSVFGLPLVQAGNGAGSNLVKAFKGEPPFGADLPNPPAGAIYSRMPADLPQVAPEKIAFIQSWIDDGCPADVAVPVALARAAAAPLRWRPTNAPIASSRTDDIWFINPQLGWAVNSNGHILKTEDGGATWTRQFATGAYLRCVGFANAQVGWVGTLTPARRLYHTTDGGATWLQVVNLPASAPVRVCGISVVNERVVFASGTNIPTDSPRMMKTLDGGQSWTAWEMRPWASILIDTFFLDELRGWVVGGRADTDTPADRNRIKPVVLFTADGGAAWTDRLAGAQAQLPLGEWGWKIQFLNDRIGFVSLENLVDAAILKTTDGGQTWTRIVVNDPQGNANLEGVGFIDERNGWVGGWGDANFEGGFTSVTVDSGVTWSSANDVGKFINRFRFFGNPVTVGYASGATVYKYSADPLTAAPAPAPARLLSGAALPVTVRPATIRMWVPEGTRRLTVDVWNRFGQHVSTPLDEVHPRSGARAIDWRGDDALGQEVPDGSYIYRVTADSEAESRIVRLVSRPPRRRSAPIRWIPHFVSLPPRSALRSLSIGLHAAAPLGAPSQQQIDLPDLSAYPTPLDKARFLLQKAAEIEHVLLVQYLYAAYSLKNAADVADAQQKTALTDWKQTVRGIAQEEMGHLMTVENLLILLRQKITLERDDLPPSQKLYPFTMHLEPLTQKSLAKYVVAESPVDATGIEDIVQLATGASGAMVNHVGVLYTLLGLIFTRRGDLESNAASEDLWYQAILDLSRIAFLQIPGPENWHLADDAFDAGSVASQGKGADFPGGNAGQIRVFTVANRAAALAALRDIAVQGEGQGQPPPGSQPSHFDRFLAVYRGTGLPFSFPAGTWQPSFNVPIDPKIASNSADPNAIVDPRAQAWARLADMRYALLLGFIEQYLLGSADERAFLSGWCLTEMMWLKQLSGLLVKMPRSAAAGDPRAALPFTLPSTVDLPDDRTAQWQVHIDRLQDAIAQAQQMLAGSDAGNGVLTALVAQDQTNLAAARAALLGGTARTRFQQVQDILNRATGDGHPLHGGQGRFWNKSLTDFLAASVYGLPVIAPPGPGRAANSNLVKALRGQPPFDGSDFPQMPLGRPPLAEADIQFIARWIDDDCPA